MKVREHRGGLAESMATVREIAGEAELLELIREHLRPYNRDVTADQVHVQPYRYDDRIEWNTHLITVDGYGVWGMSDGPIPESGAEELTLP